MWVPYKMPFPMKAKGLQPPLTTRSSLPSYTVATAELSPSSDEAQLFEAIPAVRTGAPEASWGKPSGSTTH